MFSKETTIMGYLPTKESDLKTFVENFAALVKAAPETYGLVAADATETDTVAWDYATKFDLASNPATRTQVSIHEKDAARATLTAILRGYGMQIKGNRAVLDSAKLKLGVGVYDFTATPTPAPTTLPLINIVAATPRQHELRFSDSAAPDKKGRPAGVLGLQLFCSVAEAAAGAPADPKLTAFQAFITKPRQPYTMTFAPGEVGKAAYYYARWQTATGLMGPWSRVASMTVAG